MPVFGISVSSGPGRRAGRKCRAPAEAAGLVPGGPGLSRAEWAELVRQWFPGLVEARARSLTFPVIEPFRDRIGEMLKTNTVQTVWQRLHDEEGLAVSIASFRRFVTSELAEQAAQDKVTVPRPEVAGTH